MEGKHDIRKKGCEREGYQLNGRESQYWQMNLIDPIIHIFSYFHCIFSSCVFNYMIHWKVSFGDD